MDSRHDRPADRAARLIWRLRAEVEASAPADAVDDPGEGAGVSDEPAQAEGGGGLHESAAPLPAHEPAADHADRVAATGGLADRRGEVTAGEPGANDAGDVSRETPATILSDTGHPIAGHLSTLDEDLDARSRTPEAATSALADQAASTRSDLASEIRPVDPESLSGVPQAPLTATVDEPIVQHQQPSEPLPRPVTLLTDPATLRADPANQPSGGTRVVAIANQKGGVGKTTTAVNLGAALAELNQRVLVVDLDPQGNATTGLGVNARNLALSLYDVLIHDAPLEDAVEPTAVRNLFLVPAIIDLAGAEIELVPLISRELRLRKALEPLLEDFDLVLIDCPPSLGLLTINGLAAATEVLVPIQCEYYALEGLDQLLRNVQLVRNALNPSLALSAIVLTMFDGRTRLAEQVADDVRSHFSDLVCRAVIPRAVRLSEAPSYGQPITIFDPSSRGAIAYRDLAKEVLDVASSRAR